MPAGGFFLPGTNAPKPSLFFGLQKDRSLLKRSLLKKSGRTGGHKGPEMSKDQGKAASPIKPREIPLQGVSTMTHNVRPSTTRRAPRPQGGRGRGHLSLLGRRVRIASFSSLYAATTSLTLPEKGSGRESCAWEIQMADFTNQAFSSDSSASDIGVNVWDT